MALGQILPNSDPGNWDQMAINDTLNNVFNIATTLAITVAVVFIVIGSYYYFTAFGKEDQAKKGKTTVTLAIIGLIVILLSRVIIAEVWRFGTGQLPPN